LKDDKNKVGWKARPLCAGVSVLGTMRVLRRNVDACGKTYIAASALRFHARTHAAPSGKPIAI